MMRPFNKTSSSSFGLNRRMFSARTRSLEQMQQVFSYHQDTKHHPERYAKGPGYMDWANQPNPFREYAGALRILPLQLTPVDTPFPTMEQVLVSPSPIPPQALSLRTMSHLLRDSMALSAWKSYKENRWALRCNPSSGNLHPTETYVISGPIEGLCDDQGFVSHYRPKDHALEIRAEITNWTLPRDVVLIGLSSVHWREAWKYGERAFRYCQHDVGHAICAIEIAASALGWTTQLLDDLSTESLADLMGLDNKDKARSLEEPDCLLVISTSGQTLTSSLASTTADAIKHLSIPKWHGHANVLSKRQVDWERIDAVAEATRKPHTSATQEAMRSVMPVRFTTGSRPLRPVIHQRRSAQEFDPDYLPEMTAEHFYSFFQACNAQVPSVYWQNEIHLAVMVHRVQGIEPGLYLHVRNLTHLTDLRNGIDKEYLWEKPLNCPEGLEFYRLARGDAKKVAKQVSCNQDIAGDGSFTLGMIARFEDAINERGPWFYKRLFWESGAIGQLLYLQAEAVGFRGTGIGCYFDDLVHSVLGLEDYKFQSMYHFTVGFPEVDERLGVEDLIEPYAHLHTKGGEGGASQT